MIYRIENADGPEGCTIEAADINEAVEHARLWAKHQPTRMRIHVTLEGSPRYQVVYFTSERPKKRLL